MADRGPALTKHKITWVYSAIIRPIMTYTCVTWAPRLFNNKSLMTQVNRPGDVALLIASGDRHHNMCCTNSSHSPQLHLKKAALLQALRHKSLDHWLALQIDHSVRQSFEPRQIIIERSLNTIFRQCDQSINDLTKPMDTRNETYKLNIASNDIIPLNPNKHIIITYTVGYKHAEKTIFLKQFEFYLTYSTQTLKHSHNFSNFNLRYNIFINTPRRRC